MVRMRDNMKIRQFAAMLAIVFWTLPAQGADKVRIGVSNYNISNLTVGVAQTKDFSNKKGSKRKSSA
jgi:hypothetical protein